MQKWEHSDPHMRPNPTPDAELQFQTEGREVVLCFFCTRRRERASLSARTSRKLVRTWRQWVRRACTKSLDHATIAGNTANEKAKARNKTNCALKSKKNKHQRARSNTTSTTECHPPFSVSLASKKTMQIRCELRHGPLADQMRTNCAETATSHRHRARNRFGGGFGCCCSMSAELGLVSGIPRGRGNMVPFPRKRRWGQPDDCDDVVRTGPLEEVHCRQEDVLSDLLAFHVGLLTRCMLTTSPIFLWERTHCKQCF